MSGEKQLKSQKAVAIVAEVDPLDRIETRHSQGLDWQVEGQTVLEEAVKLAQAALGSW